MGCPCEVLIQNNDQFLNNNIVDFILKEVSYLENKYSRYKKDSFIHNLNTFGYESLDEESYKIFNLATQIYNLSDGLFDITSGILGKIWKFNPDANIPTKKQINELLPYIGYKYVTYDKNSITLPKGFEIDLGGIVKEYAVDKIINSLNIMYNTPILLNLGGDLGVTNTTNNTWQIGIDGLEKEVIIQLTKGFLATSGDTYRYISHKNKKYCHILNPLTGYPVVNPPKSVSVLSNTCTTAGLITTIAILHGKNAEKFLKSQNVKYFIQW